MGGAPPADPVAEPPVVVLGVAWVAVAGFAKIVDDPADTDSVLAEHGYDADQIAAFHREKVI